MDPIITAIGVGLFNIITLIIGYNMMQNDNERRAEEKEQALKEEMQGKLDNAIALVTQRQDNMEKHQEQRDKQITDSLEKLFTGQEEQGKLLVKLVTTLELQVKQAVNEK